MINTHPLLIFLGKCALVAIGYLAGLFVSGIICSLLAIQLSVEAGSGSRFILIFIATMLLGPFLGPYASRLSLSSGQHFILWGSLILFNLGLVNIEGAYFAPDLASVSIPVLMAQKLLSMPARRSSSLRCLPHEEGAYPGGTHFKHVHGIPGCGDSLPALSVIYFSIL